MQNKYDLRGKDPLFSGVVYSILIGALFCLLIPFIYVISSSFATEHEILNRGFFLFPKEWTIDAYGYLLSNVNFMTSFKNSVVITVSGTTINIVFNGLRFIENMAKGTPRS
jgi:putative aldouronate transport system permease protein